MALGAALNYLSRTNEDALIRWICGQLIDAGYDDSVIPALDRLIEVYRPEKKNPATAPGRKEEKI